MLPPFLEIMQNFIGFLIVGGHGGTPHWFYNFFSTPIPHQNQCTQWSKPPSKSEASPSEKQTPHWKVKSPLGKWPLEKTMKNWKLINTYVSIIKQHQKKNTSCFLIVIHWFVIGPCWKILVSIQSVCWFGVINQ